MNRQTQCSQVSLRSDTISLIVITEELSSFFSFRREQPADAKRDAKTGEDLKRRDGLYAARDVDPLIREEALKALKLLKRWSG